jgi:uncharacterized phiE125 gp8 family phage protein
MEEPVTMEEAKTHLKVALAFIDDDAYITGLISAARFEAERFSRRVFLTQTWEQYLDSFPGRHGGEYNSNRERFYISVLKPRLQSIVSIQYLDQSGALQTLATSSYVIDSGSEPGRIAPASGVPWPATSHLPKAVTIRLIGGWADTADEAMALDPGFYRAKLAIMHLVGHWYFNREPVVAGQVVNLPMHVQSILYGLRP